MDAYGYCYQNPIKFNDPTGMIAGDPGEYEKNENGDWQKVSTLGDDLGLDFYHHDEFEVICTKNTKDNTQSCEFNPVQVTHVTDRKGNWNQILNGRKFLTGEVTGDGVISGDDVDWAVIFDEWNDGTGPSSSIFEGNHPANREISKHYLFDDARRDFINSNESKRPYEINFSPLDAVITGKSNMQAQMMGSYNLSFYKIGTTILSLAIDTKSRTSFYYHLPVTNIDRNTRSERKHGRTVYNNRQTTTSQTYIFYANPIND